MKKLLVTTGLTLSFGLSALAAHPDKNQVATYITNHGGAVQSTNSNGVKTINVTTGKGGSFASTTADGTYNVPTTVTTLNIATARGGSFSGEVTKSSNYYGPSIDFHVSGSTAKGNTYSGQSSAMQNNFDYHDGQDGRDYYNGTQTSFNHNGTLEGSTREYEHTTRNQLVTSENGDNYMYRQNFHTMGDNYHTRSTIASKQSSTNTAQVYHYQGSDITGPEGNHLMAYTNFEVESDNGTINFIPNVEGNSSIFYNDHFININQINKQNFSVGHEGPYYIGSTSNQEGDFYHEGLLTMKTKEGTKISHDATFSKQDSSIKNQKETTIYKSGAMPVSHQVNSHVQYTNGTVTIERSSSIDKNHAPVIAYNGSVTINTQTGEKNYQGNLTKNL